MKQEENILLDDLLEWERNEILNLVMRRDLEKLKIAAKCGLNVIGENNSSLFSLMGYDKFNKEIADLLIENGADVNITDKNGISVLDVAILLRDKSACKYLIEKGAKVKKALENLDEDISYCQNKTEKNSQYEFLADVKAKMRFKRYLLKLTNQKNLNQKTVRSREVSK